MKLIALLLLSAASAFPQLISGGFKAGVPLTDAFEIARNPRTNFFATTHRYTVGPTVELNLPYLVSIEFDALYKRLEFGSSSNLVDVVFNSKTVANSWEFPLLVKLRLSRGLVRPYVSTGASFNHLTGITQVIARAFPSGNQTTTTTSRPDELRNDNRVGFVIAGGLELRPPLVHISPEIRYTRWGSESFRDINALLRSKQDQAEFLVGITF